MQSSLLTSKYLELLTSKISIPDENRKFLEKTMILLLNDGKEIDLIRDMLGFFIPVDLIPEALAIHDEIIGQIKSSETLHLSRKEMIMHAIKTNELPHHIIEAIKTNSLSSESLVFILCFSYAMDQDKSLFNDEKSLILSKYTNHFSSMNYPFSIEVFAKVDFETLSKYKKIMDLSRENKLVNLSLRLCVADNVHLNKDLELFIKKTGEYYEELRNIFSSIKQALRGDSYVTC
jgi:hypothetical protein